MEDILTRKYKKNEIVKKKNDYLAAIDSEEATFRKVVLKDQKITNARLFYAASKINALVRGFLDRQLCKRLLRKLRAVKVIQRLIRGKLGRIRWQREYWKQLSVVKSPEALEEILKRSTIVREKFFHEKLVKYHWQEQYDPLTECFWYYNPLNKRNTWQVPYCFQQELICTWEGYRSFGGVNAKPCRCIFGNRQEYYNHMRFAHKWSCVACYSPNSGINFPNCSVCHNRYNEDGIDGESVLKESVKKVNAKISNFLYKDMKYSAFIDQYNLKTRLTDIAGFYKDVFEPMLQEEIEQSDDDSVSLNDMEKMHERQLRLMGRSFDELHKKKVKVIDLIASNMLIRNSKSREGRKTAGSPSSKRRPGSRAKNKLPAIPGVTVVKATKSTSPSRAMTPGKSSKPSGGAMAELSRQISERISRSRSRSPSRGMSRSASRPMTGRSGHLFGADYLNEIEEPMETAFLLDGNYDGTKIVKSELDNAMSTGDFYDVDKKSHRTVNQEVMARAWKAIGGYEGEEQLTRDPVLNGVFSDEMFNIITSIHSDDIHSRILKGMMFGGDEDNEEDMKSAKKRRTGGGGYDSQDDDNSSVGSVGEGSVGSLSDVSDGEGGSLEDDFSQLNLSKQQARKKKKKSKDDEKGMKLLVCPNFIDGNCSSTTCLLAHPGMRDNAQIYIKTTRNEDGSRKRIPYVYICPLTDGADLMMCRVSKLPEPIALGPDSKVPKAKKKKDSIDSLPSIPPVDDQSQEAISMPIKKNQKKDKSKPPPKPPVPEEVPERLRYRHVCSLGKQCTSYHVYVRPSTEEIILAMYPIRCGHRTKLFPDGSKLIGNVRNDKFNGYATMLWENGDVYMGDWQDDQRHGFGIYRNKDGSMEYIGQFAYGVRSGWGLLRTKNGDEYVGQWKNGKMHGVGILISSTVDQPGQSVDAEFRKDALVGKTVYHGEFKDNLYDGIGVFQRSNGDVYMGYCQGGKAHGLGILSLSTGEKYKGHFERNARHGKGCCAYPNGSRYAGTWYRGVHSGYGIYISPEGEKYIGEWDGGKKHGKGRYLFLNHDFYDGEFFKNKAKGVGVYYHANGNLYSGQWDNDMRNGRGTYVFANGSKYTGNWTNNKIHLKGRFDFANGAYYRGEFANNQKHGKGIYTWANGNVYKGEFVREKICGKGEMQYIMGHRYVGQWRDNKKNGYGFMYYANGSIYEGDWVDDIRKGKGKITFLPGAPVEEWYSGDWENDQWHGKGTYSYRKVEGTVYEGDWVYGVRHGFGKLSYKDGSFYRGQFQNDQMWGKGIFVNATEQSQYDGEWRANMRQGQGTCIEEDGSIFTGEWFGNMKQGHGKVIRNDGSVYEGVWEANIMINTGKVTFQVGDKAKKDGLKKEITVRVFAY